MCIHRMHPLLAPAGRQPGDWGGTTARLAPLFTRAADEQRPGLALYVALGVTKGFVNAVYRCARGDQGVGEPNLGDSFSGHAAVVKTQASILQRIWNVCVCTTGACPEELSSMFGPPTLRSTPAVPTDSSSVCWRSYIGILGGSTAV